MSRSSGGQPPHPFSRATFELALGLHEELMQTLGQEDADRKMQEQQGSYPGLLLGELAMHVAGIKLEPGAPAAERARGVSDALQLIVSSPELLEYIIGRPADTAAFELSSASGERSDMQIAIDLRRKIEAAGYIEHSMVPVGRLIRLDYAGPPDIRLSFKGIRRGPGPGVSLKLVPVEGKGWTINQFKAYSRAGGFQERAGERYVPLREAFSLVAVTTTEVIPELDFNVGKLIKIGPVGKDTSLTFQYDHKLKAREVVGYEQQIKYDSASHSEYAFTQAYLGDTDRYPLFPQ